MEDTRIVKGADISQRQSVIRRNQGWRTKELLLLLLLRERFDAWKAIHEVQRKVRPKRFQCIFVKEQHKRMPLLWKGLERRRLPRE